MHTRAKLLGSTALAAAAFVMAAPSASAQDLSALEKRVAALEKSQKDSYVLRSKKTMKLSVSGHLNRLIQYRDNGEQSGFLHLTSIQSRSRVRWVADGEITDDLSVRTYIELGNRSGSGSASALNDEGSNNGSATQDPFDERHFDIIFTSKTMGKLWIGQGRSGSESTSERDLSGTAVLTLNGSSPSNLFGGENLFVNGVDSGVNVTNAFNSFDGFGRSDRIRYDTPKFAGFFVAASHANGDDVDVALRYAGQFGGVKADAAIAYTNDNTGGVDTDGINGSASILLPFGLSLTGGWSEQDIDQAGRDDPKWYYGKVGYRFKSLAMGETRLFAEYGKNEDVTQDIDGDFYGFGLVQVIEPIGAEFQLGYHAAEVEFVGDDPDTVHAVTSGIRVKF